MSIDFTPNGARSKAVAYSLQIVDPTRPEAPFLSNITFHAVQNLQSWKTLFPHPSTSPACYTRSLLVRNPEGITVADAEEGGWIPTFSQIAHLEIVISGRNIDEPEAFLLPFHRFSPAIRSLRVYFARFPLSSIFNLVQSFPRLQDLGVQPGDDVRWRTGGRHDREP